MDNDDNDPLFAQKLTGGFVIEVDEAERFKPRDADEGHFRAIEKVLGATTPDSETRERIVKILNLYLSFSAVWEQAPRRKKVKRELVDFHNSAQAFEACLNRLQSPAKYGDYERDVALKLLGETKFGTIFAEDLDRFTSDVSRSAAGAKEAVKKLVDDKGGRAGNPALDMLVCRLAALYSDKTEKPPKLRSSLYAEGAGIADREYSGPFFRLVETCLELMGCPYNAGNQALGQAINRALK